MSSASSRPLLLGHRGARSHAPENTVAAFDLALQHGCDGFEFDVRLTRDARAVVCHDPLLRGISVEKSTYLMLNRRGLNPSATRFALQAAPAVPCLEDVVRTYAARAFMDIELKVPGLEKFVVQALARLKGTGKYLVSSFYPEILRELRARDPKLPIGFITDVRAHVAAWERTDVQVLVAHHKLVTGELIDDVHAAGKQIFVWTVNRERQMQQLADLGVDALISDDTELLGRVFRTRDHRK